MNVLGVIMRIYSYIFHFILSLVLLALSAVTMMGGVNNLKLDMLPWKEAQLTYAVAILGAIGILAVLLALKGIVRIFFFIWTLVVVALMIKGYIFGAYFFGNSAEFYKTLALIAGAILASIGAWCAMRQQPAKKS